MPADDGIARNIQYAAFRTDKEPSPGYSRELINVKVDPKNYDNLSGGLINDPELDTLYKHFKRQVTRYPNENFLGTREKLGSDENGKP